jgi:hypothetical protein
MIRIVGIGIGLLTGSAAIGSDVPRMNCSQIGGFAREVAQQKAEGVTREAVIRDLRQSLRSEYAETERELEKIGEDRSGNLQRSRLLP